MAEYEKIIAYKIIDGDNSLEIFDTEKEAISYCKIIELEEAFEIAGAIITLGHIKDWLDENSTIVINYLQRDDDNKEETKPNIRLLKNKELMKEGDLDYDFHLESWFPFKYSLVDIKYDHIAHGQIGRLI